MNNITSHIKLALIQDTNINLQFLILTSNWMLIQNKKVAHNSALGVFTVIGTSGNPHAVQLFPKETCTCPSTSRCYHILAVRMSVGLSDTIAHPKINLTKLRKNTRSRREKKSGRKALRSHDYDVGPAPDSMLSSTLLNEESSQPFLTGSENEDHNEVYSKISIMLCKMFTTPISCQEMFSLPSASDQYQGMEVVPRPSEVVLPIYSACMWTSTLCNISL